MPASSTAVYRTAVHRTADGRELIYSDESPGADRSMPDRRELPPPPPASELRYDPLLDEWVAVAGHRQGRTFLPPGAWVNDVRPEEAASRLREVML